MELEHAELVERLSGATGSFESLKAFAKRVHREKNAPTPAQLSKALEQVVSDIGLAERHTSTKAAPDYPLLVHAATHLLAEHLAQESGNKVFRALALNGTLMTSREHEHHAAQRRFYRTASTAATKDRPELFESSVAAFRLLSADVAKMRSKGTSAHADSPLHLRILSNACDNLRIVVETYGIFKPSK